MKLWQTTLSKFYEGDHIGINEKTGKPREIVLPAINKPLGILKKT